MTNPIDDNCTPLEQVQKRILPSKALNQLFEMGREVVFYVVNDERLTVKEISDSISTFGYSPDDFISGEMKWKDLLYPDDLKLFMECSRTKRSEHQNGKSIEYRILTKEGNPVWVNCINIPEIDDEGRITHFLCKIKDVSLSKQNEEELTAYREELEQKVKIRTEEVEAVNEYLETLNEELHTANQELQATNEQLNTEMDARVELMKRLEDSESEVRNFIHHSVEGIVMLDKEGRIIEWNKSMERLMGLSREEALGRYEWEVLENYYPKRESYEKMYESTVNYIRGGSDQEPFMEESVIQNPDSSIHYIQVSMFPIVQSETWNYGRIVRDITSQKLSDMKLDQYRTQLETMVEIQNQELLVTQNRLMSLSDNLPGGIIYQMMDDSVRTGWFSHVSASFTEVFEIGVEEIMTDPTPFYLCIHPEDRKRLIKDLIFANEKKDMDIEFRIHTPSRKTKWIHMCSIYHITNEGAREWNGLMMDITERKLATLELENTRRRQSLLIKVQQIVQSAENLPQSLNMSLAEIGNYTNVSRIYVFEINIDGNSISNTYEWCNEGIKPAINDLQNLPLEIAQPWLNIFDAGEYVCTSDVNTLTPVFAEELSAQGIKSVIMLPLMSGGANCGFVGFNDCVINREWSEGDIELLKSLSRIISDTTSRYQAETAMRLSQQAMRTVLDNINACIFVAEFDKMKILFANKCLKDLVGNEMIEGQECWKVLHTTKTKVCDYCPHLQLQVGNNSFEGVHFWEQYHEMTGRWFTTASSAIEWIDRRVVHLEVFIDITDRKKAEETVRQSEEMYRQLTVASPDAIVVCAPGGLLQYASPKAIELLGIKGAGLLPIHKFIHSNDRPLIYHLLQKTDSSNTTVIPDLTVVRQDGTEFIGEISAAAVKGPDKKVTSVIMVIRDVTRRKMEEIELIHAKERAEESDKLKSSFLANLSHEIRTPLNGISTLLSILGQDPQLPDSIREYIGIINTNSEQLLRLINDIIDLAKLEAKQMEIIPESLHIDDLMDEMHTLFESSLKTQGKSHISLECIKDESVKNCAIYTDPARLRQILHNLLDNAIKFTGQGHVRFGYHLKSDMLEFFVEDTGIGIPESQLEAIFQWFRQAELENNRRYGGTGLGLTISRGLIRLMGGNMRVESTEGVGSTFFFTVSFLPAAPKNNPLLNELSDKRYPEENIHANKTVLVVVSMTMKYKYYELLLTTAGFTVQQATGVKQCLNTLRFSNRVDAVIVDLSMLDKSNKDEIKKIKLVNSGLPLLLISNKQDEKYQQIIRDSQCDVALEEPVSREEIVRTVKRLMRSQTQDIRK